MKFQVLVLGFLFCLAAPAADKPSQGAPANKSAKAPQSLTGCMDEQGGQYVLLDNQMLKIANLQPAGSDKEVFAKHLGRRVQVRGTQSAEEKGTFKVTAIEQLSGNCGRAK